MPKLFARSDHDLSLQDVSAMSGSFFLEITFSANLHLLRDAPFFAQFDKQKAPEGFWHPQLLPSFNTHLGRRGFPVPLAMVPD